LSLTWVCSIQSILPTFNFLKIHLNIILAAWVFQVVSFPQVSPPNPYTPYVPHVPPISFFSIWSPEIYLVSSTDQ
jgi:hypothetical protein